MTENISTIHFTDADEGGEGVAIVRRCGSSVALTLSLRDDGDLQVVLDLVAARSLVAAIQQAIEVIDRSENCKHGED